MPLTSSWLLPLRACPDGQIIDMFIPSSAAFFHKYCDTDVNFYKEFWATNELKYRNANKT